MSFLDLATERYSVRSFDPKPVEKEKIDAILEAAKVAPTGHNDQGQRILVLSTEESLAKLRLCSRCHFDAPLAFFICADSEDAWVRPYDKKNICEMDASIVTTHMMLQAADIGLGCTWVMHFNPYKMREMFHIPETFVPCALLVMGYPAKDAKPMSLHESYDPMENWVFYEDFAREEH